MKKKSPLMRVLILLVIGVIVYVAARTTGLIESLPKFEWNPERIVNGVLLLLILQVSGLYV